MAVELPLPLEIQLAEFEIELVRRLNNDIIEQLLAELASADEEEEHGLMEVDVVEEVILVEPLQSEHVKSLYDICLESCNQNLSTEKLNQRQFHEKIEKSTIPTKLLYDLLVTGKDHATKTNKNFSSYAKVAEINQLSLYNISLL